MGMKRYLVTGGCGFIGSHLVAALLRQGSAVRVLDDLSTGSEANLPPGVELLRGSICDAALVASALQDVDGCYHLAAIASVEQGVRNWRGTHEVNLSGWINVLEAAARLPAPRIPLVYASSAAVYGDTAAPPALGEDLPARPLSAYGADKLGCEQQARVGGVVHAVPTIGFRFFNVYGPRQDPKSPYSGVISIFCDRLSRGEPVEVYGDGLQSRDFVYVADVVAALLAATGKATVEAPVLNVCTGQPTSIRALAGAIAALCGVVPDMRERPPRSGEVRHSLGSPERLRAALGLGEPVPLDEGLRETLSWMREVGAAGGGRQAPSGG